jgi:hypothetical protein
MPDKVHRSLEVLFVFRSPTAIALLTFGLAAIGVSAQNAPNPPAISVSTRLVQVGVIARDKNGPVADLTKDDFVLLDRGKPQNVLAAACAAVAAKHVFRSAAVWDEQAKKRDDCSARQPEHPFR